MKGLLKKDLALLANTGKIYVGVSLFCMVLGLVNEDMRDFSLSFLVIMFSLAAPSTLSYDEFDNGMPWLMTLSADRSVYAKEKYLLSILLGLAGAVVAVILGVLVFQINPFQGGSDSQIAILVAFFFTSGLMLAVMIPAKLKFGLGKITGHCHGPGHCSVDSCFCRKIFAGKFGYKSERSHRKSGRNSKCSSNSGIAGFLWDLYVCFLFLQRKNSGKKGVLSFFLAKNMIY